MKWKFKLGQKVIYNEREVKIIGKENRIGPPNYVVELDEGWMITEETIEDIILLKGTPIDGTVRAWLVCEKELEKRR